MEALGDILNRIMSDASEKRTNLRSNGVLPEPSTATKADCHRCHGALWVSRAVPVGHPDFGEAFPCACQSTTEDGRKRLRAYANLPRDLRCNHFEDFEERPGVVKALEAAKEFADGHTENRGLTLQGPSGLGKSTLLTCIGNEMLEQGYAVKYCFVPEMLSGVISSFSDDAEVPYTELLGTYTAADVLLLDDITEMGATAFAREFVTRLVDQRYRNGNLFVVATNLDVDMMGDIWGYRLADRLFDQGSGLVRVVFMGGESYRTGRKWGLPWLRRRRRKEA